MQDKKRKVHLPDDELYYNIEDTDLMRCLDVE